MLSIVLMVTLVLSWNRTTLDLDLRHNSGTFCPVSVVRICRTKAVEAVVAGRGVLPVCPLEGGLRNTTAVRLHGQPDGGQGILSTFQPAQA